MVDSYKFKGIEMGGTWTGEHGGRSEAWDTHEKIILKWVLGKIGCE